MKIIESYCKVARPIMRRWMPAASCIGATQLTILTLRGFGITAVPFTVSYQFEVPGRKYARVGGFPREEAVRMRQRAEAAGCKWTDEGAGLKEETWPGHLVALVEKRWILDPTVDQMGAEQFGVSIPSEVLCIDTKGNAVDFESPIEMQLGLVLDDGRAATLTYWSLSDESYKGTPAWNDEGLPLLAAAIASKLLEEPRI